MKQIFLYLILFISILGCKKNEKSWTAVNNGISNDWDNTWESAWVNTIATQMDNVYASVQVGTDYGATFEIGVYLSNNHGKSWIAVNNGLPHDIRVNTIAVQGNNIYAGTYASGVYLSSNYGNNWTAINDGLPTKIDVWAITIQGNTIYAGTDEGVYVTSNY